MVIHSLCLLVLDKLNFCYEDVIGNDDYSIICI